MINYLPDILSGVLNTLILMLASVFLGALLAICLTLCQFAESVSMRKLANGFIFFVCGTPLLVQIFLIYFGAGQFDWIRDSILWIVLRDPFSCAILALTINTASYTAVILKGAIHSVPSNEIDAAFALGMSKWLAMRRVILPRAFRIAVPAYSNEVVMALKNTALASTITVLEIMGVTQELITQTYNTVHFYLLAAAIYLVLNLIIILIFRRLNLWSKKSRRVG